MKNSIFKIAFVLTLGFSVSALHLYAPPSPPAGGGTPACWPPPCVPIDGGLGFLLVAGAAFGAKKAFEKRKA